MKTTRFFYPSSDGRQISALQWLPSSGEVRAVLQISHGMAEHIARYDDFAAFLTKQGIAVYGNDHRGHGQSTGPAHGFLAPKNGDKLLIEDKIRLRKRIEKDYPDCPVFLLAHSMGSFYSRVMLAEEGENYSGVILSGTGWVSAAEARLMGFLAKAGVFFKQNRSENELLHSLAFEKNNDPFQPAVTGMEWLSRDKVKVEEYIGDSLCGFICTSEFYRDFAKTLKKAASSKILKNTPKDLPILIYSGSMDPIGDMGKGVAIVHSKYKKQGLTDLTLKLNDDGRHESLNETNREEVYEFFYEWIKTRIA